jgi:hypothetical protein
MKISVFGMRFAIVLLYAGVRAAKLVKRHADALRVSTLRLNPSVRKPANMFTDKGMLIVRLRTKTTELVRFTIFGSSYGKINERLHRF